MEIHTLSGAIVRACETGDLGTFNVLSNNHGVADLPYFADIVINVAVSCTQYCALLLPALRNVVTHQQVGGILKLYDSGLLDQLCTQIGGTQNREDAKFILRYAVSTHIIQVTQCLLDAKYVENVVSGDPEYECMLDELLLGSSNTQAQAIKEAVMGTAPAATATSSGRHRHYLYPKSGSTDDEYDVSVPLFKIDNPYDRLHAYQRRGGSYKTNIWITLVLSFPTASLDHGLVDILQHVCGKDRMKVAHVIATFYNHVPLYTSLICCVEYGVFYSPLLKPVQELGIPYAVAKGGAESLPPPPPRIVVAAAAAVVAAPHKKRPLERTRFSERIQARTRV